MTDPKNPATLPVIWRAIVDESTGYFINGEKGLLLNEVRLIQTGTAFVAAQAAIDELRAKLQEQALQALSDDGQWIEHTGKLQAEVELLTRERDEAIADAKEIRARWNDAENEFAALKTQSAASLPHVDALMALADAMAKASAMLDRAIHSVDCMCSPQSARKQFDAARSALRTALVAALSLPGGEDARDAARLQYLIDNAYNSSDGDDGIVLIVRDSSKGWDDRVRAAIDAAMSTNNLPGEGEKL